MDLTCGVINIQLIPQYPVTQESVTLNVTGVTGRILSFIWHKGPYTSVEYQILTYVPHNTSPLLNGTLYFSRARPFPNGSLLISDLHTTDRGNYIVKVQTDKPAQQASVNLTIYERVSKPKVTASTSLPKENCPFILTCDTSNAERILWTKDRVSLPCGLILSEDNRTVTFHIVKLADSGEYLCEAENPVSKNISDPYTLTVSYGLQNVQITGQLDVRVGSVISLRCSTDSVPPPSYQWKFNSTDLNITQNTLRVDRVSLKRRGTYICEVNNSVTLRTATAFVYVNVSSECSPTTSGWNIGSVIGIVVAVLLLAVLVTLLVYLFLMSKQHKKPSNNIYSVAEIPSRNGDVSISFQERPELQYAAIEFNKNIPRKKQQPPGSLGEDGSPPRQPPPENVVYSELRLQTSAS
ncbi:cell adhesion molecule CEACAM6-like isoform X2 [Mixophyes fleayi]|uniref:cell adhesion molecule CEACAM6-like isoform X2 n=1 Tax=Mixophyes fleayi TaxID=3061075 RepID=UPI003F4E3D1D